MKNILLWLEDHPEEIADLISNAREKFDDVIVRRNPMGMKRALEELDLQSIRGIVIDVMLTQVKDLKDICLEYIKTPGGFNTGLAFMKYFLFCNPEWQKIPVCILTVIEDERILQLLKDDENAKDVKVIEKFLKGWDQEFLNWLDSLTQKKEDSQNER